MSPGEESLRGDFFEKYKKIYFNLDNPNRVCYYTICITPKTAGAARRKFQTPAEEKLHKVHVMEF